MGVLLAFPSRFALGDRRLRGLGTGGFYVELGHVCRGSHVSSPPQDARRRLCLLDVLQRDLRPALGEARGQAHPRRLRDVLRIAPPRGRRPRICPPGPRAACWPPRRVSPGAWPRRSWPSGAAGRRSTSSAPTGTGWPISRPGTATRMPSPASVRRIFRWRDEVPAPARNEAVLFEDRHGRAGWFVAQVQPDVGQSKIKNYFILDLIYPPQGLDLAALVDAIAARYADRADLLYLPRAIAEQSRLRPPKLWCRRTPFATSYLIDPEYTADRSPRPRIMSRRR